METDKFLLLPPNNEPQHSNASVSQGLRPTSHAIAEKLASSSSGNLLDEMMAAANISTAPVVIQPVVETKSVAKAVVAVVKPPQDTNYGFQTGFLNSQPLSQPKPKQLNQPQIENITTIRSSKLKGVVLPEVREAMANQERCLVPPTELLECCKRNPVLLQGLSDPRMVRVLEDLQTDPQGTMEKYKNDRQVMNILNEFYTEISRFRRVESSGDVEVDRVLQNRELVALLQDEQVQAKIRLSVSDPRSFRRLLAVDAVFARQVKLMCEAGLLKLE